MKRASHDPQPSQAMTLADVTGQALVIPEFAKNDADAVALNTTFDTSDLKLPQLKICQSMTPQRKRTNEKFIEGLEEGVYFNDLTGEIYGPTVRVTLLKRWTTFINQKPLDQGGGIICRSPGACPFPCPKAEWPADGSKPACTKFWNYLFYLPDHDDVLWFSVKSTALKPMKFYHSTLRFKHVAAVGDFAKITVFSTEPATNAADQEYYIPTTPSSGVSGIIGDPVLYAKLKNLTRVYAAKSIDTTRAEVPSEDNPLDDDLPM